MSYSLSSSYPFAVLFFPSTQQFSSFLFSQITGLPLGLFLIFAFCFVTEFSIFLLIKTSLNLEAKSYSDLVHRVLGRKGRKVMDLLLAIFIAGILVIYLVIIGTVFGVCTVLVIVTVLCSPLDPPHFLKFRLILLFTKKPETMLLLLLPKVVIFSLGSYFLSGDVLCGTTGTDSSTGVLVSWTGANYWWTSRPVVLSLLTLFILAPLMAIEHIGQYIKFRFIKMVNSITQYSFFFRLTEVDVLFGHIFGWVLSFAHHNCVPH